MRREESGLVDTGVLHDGSDVVHPRFEGRDVAQAVGESHASFVEHDHARERCEPFRVSDEKRLLPDGCEIREAATNDYEV